MEDQKEGIQIDNSVQNTKANIEDIQSNNILGVYDKDTNSFVSLEINEGRNIGNILKRTSIFEACKKLHEFEELNNIDDNEKLTKVFALNKDIIVKAIGVSDEQVYDELSKYDKEALYKENELNEDIYINKKLFNYENAYNVPENERLILAYDNFGKYINPLDVNNESKIFDPMEEGKSIAYKAGFNYIGRLGVTDEHISNRLEFYNKTSNIITELIKDDKSIDRFMIRISLKDEQELYIDDVDYKGVTDGPVNYLSRQEQIQKLMETIIIFKDPVIVNSKDELIKLQDEYRKDNGITTEKDTEQADKNTEVADKNTENKKAELLKLMDGQNTRGYIRIPHEDYADIKNQIEEMDIPYIAKESGIKVGMNIVVPTNVIYELKSKLLENNIEILQEVEGNIDWYKLKKIKGLDAHYVTKETLKGFQNSNNDKFKYIAFENKGKYSIYTEPGCTVEIKGDKITKSEKNKTDDKKTLKDVAKMKDDYKKFKEVTENKNHDNNERGER